MKNFSLNCACHDYAHTIWFEYDEEEDLSYRSLAISTHFPSTTLFERIKIAIGYIFNSRSGMYADMCCFDQDVANLEDFLQGYRNT